MLTPIAMAEEYWASSPFSVARHYGGIRLGGEEYTILDKTGRTVFETAIPPGEPADLVQDKWRGVYKALGRDAFLAYIKKLPDDGNRAQQLRAAKAHVREMKAKAKAEAKRQEPQLFQDHRPAPAATQGRRKNTRGQAWTRHQSTRKECE